ncbi:hypothetical protein [Streptomyces sp. NPDC054804]
MTRSKERAEDTCPLDYQCRLPLSTSTVKYLADLLRRHLKAIRSRWRILPPGRITVIVSAVLRHDQRLADMAGGNNVSESTVRRWRDKLIALLAAQASRLDRALQKVAKQGGEVVLIDGTLIPTRRHTGKADRQNYSNGPVVVRCSGGSPRSAVPTALQVNTPRSSGWWTCCSVGHRPNINHAWWLTQSGYSSVMAS